MTRRTFVETLAGLLIILLAVGVAYDSARVFSLSHRLGGDEQQTCLIQQRGLPAGHELADVMADVHALLTYPPAKGQPVPPLPEQWTIVSLDRDVALYLRDEAKQPASRHC